MRGKHPKAAYEIPAAPSAPETVLSRARTAVMHEDLVETMVDRLEARGVSAPGDEHECLDKDGLKELVFDALLDPDFQETLATRVLETLLPAFGKPLPNEFYCGMCQPGHETDGHGHCKRHGKLIRELERKTLR